MLVSPSAHCGLGLTSSSMLLQYISGSALTIDKPDLVQDILICTVLGSALRVAIWGQLRRLGLLPASVVSVVRNNVFHNTLRAVAHFRP